MKEELLEKYFLDQLSSDEEVLFQKMLAEDSAFKETFEFETSVRNVARSERREVLRSKLRGIETARNQTAEVTIAQREAKGGSKFWKAFAIAASIAIIVSSAWTLFFGNTNTNDALFAANYEIYPNIAYNITRSDAGDDSLEKKAFTYYEQGNYEAALATFEHLKESNPSPDINFYSAQAMLAEGQYESAQRLFKNLSTGKYEAEALWYQSLIALKLDTTEDAIKSLHALIENGSYKKLESEQLLKSLE